MTTFSSILKSIQNNWFTEPYMMTDYEFSDQCNASISVNKKVLVFGARSDLGFFLLPHLAETGWSVFAFTRDPDNTETYPDITWVSSDDFQNSTAIDPLEIPYVISLIPIWTLPDYCQILKNIQARSLIAFSSTSVVAKENSTDLSERNVANLLQQGENWIIEKFSVEKQCALIFRPTIIYGGPYNRNVNRIRDLIKIFRFFVLAGDGEGRRQPVHAEDLTDLCLQCLESPTVGTKIYTLVGGETLSYRQMVEMIFLSMGLKPRVLSLPGTLLKFLVRALRLLPNQKDITFEMVSRMEQDLCYDDHEATDQLGWNPRVFLP